MFLVLKTKFFSLSNTTKKNSNLNKLTNLKIPPPPDVDIFLFIDRCTTYACCYLSSPEKFSQVPKFDVRLLFYIPKFCLIVVLNIIDKVPSLFSLRIQANNPAILCYTSSTG